VVAVAAIALVIVIMSASYVFSFAAIAEAAAWSGTTQGLQVIAPIFIDGPILAYTITYTVFRYRREPSTRSIWVLYVFTSISTIINVAHALIFNDIELSRWQTWVGALIAASAPLGALLASEEVIRLALAPPSRDLPADGQRAAAASAPQVREQATHTAAPVEAADAVEAGSPSATAEHPTRDTTVAAAAEDAPFDPDYDRAPEDTADDERLDMWASAPVAEVTELDLVLLDDGRVSA